MTVKFVLHLLYQNNEIHKAMNAKYTRPSGNVKLTKDQVIEAMENGAILQKTYCVYSYWSLVFPDGKEHYNIRKGAAESARSSKNVVLIEAGKNGVSYQIA